MVVDPVVVDDSCCMRHRLAAVVVAVGSFHEDQVVLQAVFPGKAHQDSSAAAAVADFVGIQGIAAVMAAVEAAVEAVVVVGKLMTV